VSPRIPRRCLAACLAWLLACVACASAAEPVTLLGGPLAESCPMMLMAEEDAFAPLGLESVFVPWQSPDQYRAMMVSGQADFVALSTLEYARLAKRLKNVELLFTLAGSPLWLLGPTREVALAELRGKTVALPFRGGMPEITLAMLLRRSPVAIEDLRIVSGGGAVTSAQLVMTGRADYALATEPVAAMVVALSRQRPDIRVMHYAFDVADAWHKAYPDGPDMLLSNIVSLDAPEPVRRLFREQYRRYAERCRQDPRAAVPIFRKYFPVLPPDSVHALLSTGGGRLYQAAEKRGELERFLGLMEQVVDEIR
jgi:NitT/TauT family transport system substrate-binding protein